MYTLPSNPTDPSISSRGFHVVSRPKGCRLSCVELKLSPWNVSPTQPSLGLSSSRPPTKPLLHATTMIRIPQPDTSTQFGKGSSRPAARIYSSNLTRDTFSRSPPFPTPRLSVNAKPRTPLILFCFNTCHLVGRTGGERSRSHETNRTHSISPLRLMYSATPARRYVLSPPYANRRSVLCPVDETPSWNRDNEGRFASRQDFRCTSCARQYREASGLRS